LDTSRQVRRAELEGPRAVVVEGGRAFSHVGLPSGARVPLGARLLGRWEMEQGAVGRFHGVTLSHNGTKPLDPRVLAAAHAALGGAPGYEQDAWLAAPLAGSLHPYLEAGLDATVTLGAGSRWDVRACQLRSAAGVALALAGDDAAAQVTECKLGGLGPHDLAAAAVRPGNPTE